MLPEGCARVQLPKASKSNPVFNGIGKLVDAGTLTLRLNSGTRKACNCTERPKPNPRFCLAQQGTLAWKSHGSPAENELQNWSLRPSFGREMLLSHVTQPSATTRAVPWRSQHELLHIFLISSPMKQEACAERPDVSNSDFLWVRPGKPKHSSFAAGEKKQVT